MILIIDNYDSFTHNLYQGIAQFHPDVHLFRNDRISLAAIKQLQPAAIILSPGPGRPEEAGICIELIQALGSQIPILGVCLGLQAIVTAFGGQIIPAPEIVHGKQETIFHHRQGLYQHLPLPFQAARYHSLVAERASLPETLAIEAENASGLIMGIRHKQFPLFGVQFHPESILTPMGNRLLQDFVEQYVHKVGETLC
jgi:anthranilate synthase/aminodeoxychorismate synthase-like glutamine amidotransferase